MPSQSASLATLPPRILIREAAAAYVGVSANTFDSMVEQGTMPHPKMLYGKRKGWDVRELDTAIDRLPIEGAQPEDDTWEDVKQAA